MNLSDSHHFHKTVAGVCMLVGPLCALGAFIVSPPLKSEVVPQIVQVAQHQDRFLISTLLSLVAVLLTTGAVMGLMHMLRERMTGLGNTGGLLALVGLLATMAQVGMSFVLWPMALNGVQPADVSTWDSITSEAAIVIPMFIVPWVAVVGFGLLGVGLYRAHAVHGWMAATVTLGALGITLAGPLASLAVGIVGAALFLVGLGAIGLMVLGETDADWEHTPEYRGFRPAAGIS